MDEARKQNVYAVIRRFKESDARLEHTLPVYRAGRQVAMLEPVTWHDMDRPDAVELLAQWRQEAAFAFPSQFPVTLDGTRRWIVKQLLELPDRLLFWVTDLNGRRLGHVGLFRFDFAANTVEIDNIVRGVHGVVPGLMQAAVETLLDWTARSFPLQAILLEVFSDNPRAIRLYERCGFQEIDRRPMVRVDEGPVIRWVPATGAEAARATRHFVVMRVLPGACRASRPVAAA